MGARRRDSGARPAADGGRGEGDHSRRGAEIGGGGPRPGEAVGRALLAAMRERGLSAADVARDLPPGMDRATLHRLLAGKTGDTRLTTLLDACRAIGVGPAEVLHRAGLDPRPRRGEGPLDEGLRRAFARVRALPEPLRRVAVAQIGGLVEATQELAGDKGATEPQSFRGTGTRETDRSPGRTDEGR